MKHESSPMLVDLSFCLLLFTFDYFLLLLLVTFVYYRSWNHWRKSSMRTPRLTREDSFGFRGGFP